MSAITPDILNMLEYSRMSEIVHIFPMYLLYIAILIAIYKLNDVLKAC